MKPVTTSGTIQVDMHVIRYQEFPEDGVVQIWGYVGDYEASVWLPVDDQRVQRLLHRKKSRPRSTGETGSP
jgi:hypothetical protein